MSDLISRDELYEKEAALEAAAFCYVRRLMERDGDEPSVERKIWSAILIERTAFKHDIYDAPSAQQAAKEGHWIDFLGEGFGVLKCSECGAVDSRMYLGDKYCPNCGAKMEVE